MRRSFGPGLRGVLLSLVFAVSADVASGAGASALQLEAKIPLGTVSGRIDHIAVDLKRERLFVAELGNDSVGVVDLKQRSLFKRLAGLKHPQGLGYSAATDTILVANAGDGSVHLFHGSDLSPAGRIDLGDDADNIRVDNESGRAYVGYGGGALAIIDPSKNAKVGDLALKAHPEGFQIDPTTGRIYANVPDANEIAIVDPVRGAQVAAWRLPSARANFPLAIDPVGHRVLAVFRHPAKLVVFGDRDGQVIADVGVCGDADDLFVDDRRHRIYVSCGDGFLDTFAQRGLSYERIGHIATAVGARTSLFVPALDRLFLAVRARPSEPAAIWVFRPTP